jgi:integrase
MYKVTIKDVFLATIIDKRVTDSQGKHPVRLRISHKGNKAYFTISRRLSFSEEEWVKLPTAKNEKAKSVKEIILDEFNYIQSLVRAITEHGEYSHDKLRKYKDKEPVKKIRDKFALIINELRKNGQIRSADLYLNTLNNLTAYGGDKLVFEDITPKWLEEYEKTITNADLAQKSITNVHKFHRKKVHISCTTLGIYLRNLRAVFNQAIADGDIPEAIYPFSRNSKDGKYKIPTSDGTKIALTVEQLAAIETYQAINKLVEDSRDLFLLSFHLAGINMMDLLLIRWQDYKSDEITFVREKTKRTSHSKGKKIHVSVNTKAQELIKKLSATSKGEYILPYMTPKPTPEEVVKITKNLTKLVNKHLSFIGRELGIEGLTTYVARHTFATILKNSGVSIAFISESLGHQSINTTQSYMKSFEREQRDRTFDILSNITKK